MSGHKAQRLDLTLGGDNPDFGLSLDRRECLALSPLGSHLSSTSMATLKLFPAKDGAKQAITKANVLGVFS
jgi:hypothetical protein